MLGWNNQVPEPESNRLLSEELMLPAFAVRLIVGKNAARAAPILALAAFSACSAARISGRRVSRVDGISAPSGDSNVRSCSGKPEDRPAGILVPISRRSAFLSSAT